MDPQLAAIVAAQRRENAEADARIAARVERALCRADELTRLIRAIDPRVTQVWLFGSLAKRTVRDESFDIDLAVSGGDVAQLEPRLEDPEFCIDLVDLDAASPEFAALVRSQGVPLYEA